MKIFYWTMAVLILSTLAPSVLFFLLVRGRVAPRHRMALTLSTVVVSIALYHYVRIFNSWVDAFSYTGGSYVQDGIPFNEATKHNKDAAIENFNADMLARTADGRPRMQLREGSPLSEELSRVQWMRVRSATGRQMEDPSIPNDTTDAGLYAHRAAWHHRIRPEAPPPPIGSDAYYAAAEKAMEHANHTQDDEDDFEPAW